MNRIRPLLLFVALILSYASIASAKTIDLRNASEPNTYYVVFIARTSPGGGGVPGHAYVAWGVEDSTKKMSWGESYGFYPVEGKGFWSVVAAVPGQMKDEMKNGSAANATHHLVVIVNESAFQATRKTFEDWKANVQAGKTKFNLEISNCVSFTNDVAEKLGLKRPATLLKFPQTYVQELIDKN